MRGFGSVGPGACIDAARGNALWVQAEGLGLIRFLIRPGRAVARFLPFSRRRAKQRTAPVGIRSAAVALPSLGFRPYRGRFRSIQGFFDRLPTLDSRRACLMPLASIDLGPRPRDFEIEIAGMAHGSFIRGDNSAMDRSWLSCARPFSQEGQHPNQRLNRSQYHITQTYTPQVGREMGHASSLIRPSAGARARFQPRHGDIDLRDKETPDAWISRDPDLERLTGTSIDRSN